MTIFRNIVTHYGATPDGGLAVGPVLTAAAGGFLITASVPLWTGADVNKIVRINKPEGGQPTVSVIIAVTNGGRTIEIHHSYGAWYQDWVNVVCPAAVWGTNCFNAFHAFHEEFDGETDLVVLTCPPGIYMINGDLQMAIGGGQCYKAQDSSRVGLRRLQVEAAGAGFAGNFTFGSGSNSGLPWPQETGTALLNTVLAGATTATTKVAGYGARFAVGQWCFLGSLDTQFGGFPPNCFNFDWVKITAIDMGAGPGGTDRVTFTPAVRYNHLDTRPAFFLGTPDLCPLGGPAMLWGMHKKWDIDVKVNGPVNWISDYGAGMNATGLSIWFNDLFGWADGPTVTSSKTWRITNGNFPARSFEADKAIDTVIIEGGTFLKLFTQSSQPLFFYIDGASFISGYGTPAQIGCGRNTYFNNLYCDGTNGGGLKLGISYGQCEYIEVKNSYFADLTAEPLTQQVDYLTLANGVIGDAGITPAGQGSQFVLDYMCNDMGPLIMDGFFQFTGPIINYSSYYSTGLSPGYAQGRNPETSPDFTLHCQTDLPSSTWPARKPRSNDGHLRIGAHPARKVYFENITAGSHYTATLQLDQPGARNRPLWEYAKRTITASDFEPSGGQSCWIGNVWGELVSIKINVSTPYIGPAGSLKLHVFLNAHPSALDPPNYSTETYFDAYVNLKEQGERIITPTTISGARPGDIWPNGTTGPGAFVMGGGIVCQIESNVRNDGGQQPIVTYEVIADQKIAPLGPPPPPPPPPPSLTSVSASASYTEDASPTVLSAGATVGDTDSANLVGGTIVISSGLYTGDVLAAATAGTSITASYNSGTGTLTLSGTDTLAHYQQVLRTVTYASNSSRPTNGGANPTRTVSWTVNDGTSDSNAPTTLITVSEAPTPLHCVSSRGSLWRRMGRVVLACLST